MAAAWGGWRVAVGSVDAALVKGLLPGLQRCREAFDAFGRACAGLGDPMMPATRPELPDPQPRPELPRWAPNWGAVVGNLMGGGLLLAGFFATAAVLLAAVGAFVWAWRFFAAAVGLR